MKVFAVEEVDHYEHNRTTMLRVCTDMDVVMALGSRPEPFGMPDASPIPAEAWRKGTDNVWEAVVPDTNELTSVRATERLVLDDARECMVRADYHSDPIVEVYHGLTEPAVACDFHATFFTREVYRAHAAIIRERS